MDTRLCLTYFLRLLLLSIMCCSFFSIKIVSAIDNEVQKEKDFLILPQEFYNTDGGYAYTYAPSIIKENDTYHVFACSLPKDEQGGNPYGAWDFIRYTKSIDSGKTWSTPVISLKSKMNAQGIDRSACDPSVVYYKGYYYMYYGSVYRTGYINNVPQYYTHVQVARAEQIEGPYLTYTMNNTWEFEPNDPKPIIYPYYKEPNLNGVPLAGEQSLGYGAGQPTVLVKDDQLYLWYVDTSRSDRKESPAASLNLIKSDDPVNWGNLSIDGKTWSPKNVAKLTSDEALEIGEIKYDDIRGLFTTVVIHDNHNVSSSLWITDSIDGVHWSKARILTPAVAFPNFSHNIGMEGDRTGHIRSDKLMVGFGSAKDFDAQSDRWGNWDLKGIFVSLKQQTVSTGALTMLESEKNLQEQLSHSAVLKESAMTKLIDTNVFLDSAVFDWKYYTAAYPDLRSLTETEARFHWKNYGSIEGRNAHSNFLARYYIQSNPALARILQWNPDDLSTYARAIQHFIFSGRSLGKTGTKQELINTTSILDPKVFNWEFYTRKPKYESLYLADAAIVTRNSDLTFMNEEQAKNHWIHFGLYEGRPSSPEFWITRYFDQHPELRSELGSTPKDYLKYVMHFMQR
ncbi:MAG: sialidase family protein [Candidatus Gracilibacteria bacterium]